MSRIKKARVRIKEDVAKQRKNISQPAEWWRAFQEQADAEGKCLSEFMGDVLRQYVEKHQGKQLRDRMDARYKEGREIFGRPVRTS